MKSDYITLSHQVAIVQCNCSVKVIIEMNLLALFTLTHTFRTLLCHLLVTSVDKSQLIAINEAQLRTQFMCLTMLDFYRSTAVLSRIEKSYKGLWYFMV